MRLSLLRHLLLGLIDDTFRNLQDYRWTLLDAPTSFSEACKRCDGWETPQLRVILIDVVVLIVVLINKGLKPLTHRQTVERRRSLPSSARRNMRPSMHIC